MKALESKREVRDTSKIVVFSKGNELDKQLSVENIHCSGAEGSNEHNSYYISKYQDFYSAKS